MKKPPCADGLCLVGYAYSYDQTPEVFLHDFPDWFKQEMQTRRNLKQAFPNTDDDPEHFFDKRRSRTFRFFTHCPDCGHDIDWNALKKEALEA